MEEKTKLTDQSLAYIRSLIEQGRLKVKAEEYSPEAETSGTMFHFPIKGVFALAKTEYPATNKVSVLDGVNESGSAMITVMDAEETDEFDYCANCRYFCEDASEESLIHSICHVLEWILNFKSMPQKTMDAVNVDENGWAGKKCLAKLGDAIVNVQPDSMSLNTEGPQIKAIRVEILIPVKYTVENWPEGVAIHGPDANKKEIPQA